MRRSDNGFFEINIFWMFFFDRLANGKLGFAKVSIVQWVTIANITVYVLILLLLLSVTFGVIGIIKALSEKTISKDRRWIIVALIGILLGILPLLISGLGNTTWFRLLFL
jgi:hypothetical protein